MKPVIIALSAILLRDVALRSEQPPTKGVNDSSGSFPSVYSGQASAGVADGDSSNSLKRVSAHALALLKNNSKPAAMEKAMERLPVATLRLSQLLRTYGRLKKLPWLKNMETDPDLAHRLIWVRSRLESSEAMPDTDREQAQEVDSFLTAYGELQEFRNIAGEVASQVFYISDATEKGVDKSQKAIENVRITWLERRYKADKALWDARKKLKVPAGDEPAFPMRPKFPSSGDLE